uniref:Uncharacterized protein n=1 Tax=Rhizophora mucronata TaxID=61149 RepID=A0A2P2R2S2_RHIMU
MLLIYFVILHSRSQFSCKDSSTE